MKATVVQVTWEAHRLLQKILDNTIELFARFEATEKILTDLSQKKLFLQPASAVSWMQQGIYELARLAKQIVVGAAASTLWDRYDHDIGLQNTRLGT